MAVHVVTDSTADFPQGRVPAAVTVVPLRVHVGELELRDRVDCTDDEFMARLSESRTLPRTSVPPPGEFAEVYRTLLRAPGDAVVSIHIAEALSGTCQSARTAAGLVDPARIHVVDSRSVTMGLGFLVLDAAARAEAGEGALAIVAALPQLRARTGVVCLLDTLRHLERGGRIGRVQAIVGTLLSIKPLAAIGPDGVLEPIGRAHSQAQGRGRLVEALAAREPIVRLGVLHVGNRRGAEAVRAAAARRHPELEIGIGQASSVIATHAGPGTLGICFVGAPGGG
ncbi:MAG TPA: DegV family protein [Verrucomicrobiae bacterium]|nr:DegV family protein [Verrucomicrobiae bacterium]